MDCLTCNGRYERDEVLFEDGGDGPDIGPVCVHCFSKLVTIATRAKRAVPAVRAIPTPIRRRRAFGPGLVEEL